MNLFQDGFAITPELTLPADADARRIAFVGMSGSGKTSDAKVLVERLARAGRRVCVVDPNGVWHGLKTSSDGTGPGLPFVLFGGRHADVPLEASAGAAVADLVMDDGLPVVLDLSAFEADADGLRVAAEFINRLRFRQNADHEPILLVVDEADLIAPQNARKEDGASQRALINVAKRSRADGLGLLVITQRPVGLATSILNQMEAVFLLRFAGYNDLDRVKDWLGAYLSAAQRDEVIAALPSLSEGECFVSSPAWMKTFRRVQFPLPETFDSSATPRAGGARRVAQARADVDLSALARRFTAAIEAERENDPEELKRRIGILQQQIKGAPARAVEVEKVVEKIVEVERVVEVPILEAGQVEQLRAIADTLAAGGKDMVGMAQEILTRVGLVHGASPAPREQLQHSGAELPGKSKSVPKNDVPKTEAETTEAETGKVSSAPSPVPTRPQQAILDTLAELRRFGMDAPLREHVAVFADVSPKSSGYGNNLGALRSAGLLDYPAPGRLSLAVSGLEAARPSDRPLTRTALHKAWLSRLPRPQANLLGHLIACYPRPMTRQVLAGYAGVSASSSGYGNNLGALRGLGLLDYPKAGQVAAARLLFPDGLPAE